MGPMHDAALRAELARSRVEALTTSGARSRVEREATVRPALTVLLRIRRRRERALRARDAHAAACPLLP